METLVKESETEIRKLLHQIIDDYPPSLRADQLVNVERHAFNIRLVLRKGAHLVDFGGGVGAFSLACKLLGMEVTIVDDFNDPSVCTAAGQLALEHFQKHEIQIIRADLLSLKLSDVPAEADIISCFETVEHLHGSPKGLFQVISQMLRPGGKLIVATPNAVSAYNRAIVLSGKTNYYPWQDFYHAGVYFRGHVREPVLTELLDLVGDSGLQVTDVLGKNWRSDLKHRLPPWVLPPARLVAHILELFPTLCHTLYVVAQQPLQ